MKKTYVLPMARIIELQMNENIANSQNTGTIVGGWSFTNEAGAGSCFEVVTGTGFPSLYEGNGYTSSDDLLEAGFNPNKYYAKLAREYDDDIADAIELQCGNH